LVRNILRLSYKNSFINKIQMSNNGQLVVSRENITAKIKRWVQLDTQLKMINEKTKLMREERNTLTSEICDDLEKSGIDKRKIILPDGDLKVYEK